MGFFNWAAPMFNRSADRWDSESIHTIAEWLRPSVAPGGSFVDVGGGTGALAAKLAHALSARATVLDSTSEMLRYARDTEAVTAVLGEAEAMPFADGAFDALLVTDALHHIRNQSVAASEFRRVLRLGGRVLALELDREAKGMRFVVWGERLLGEPAAFLTPTEMRELMAQHHILGECTRESGASYRFIGEAQ
jgi:ubiquinone/menaquinone biosynthesis C-methylase UbiE